MPRLLFLAYWIPPRSAVGCIRANHVLKYLPQSGWEVTTVTARFGAPGAQRSSAAVVETGYTDVKAVLKNAAGISNRSAHEALRLEVPAYGRRRAAQRLLAAAARAVTYPDEYVGWLPYAARAVRRLAASGMYDAVLSTAPPMTANVAVALARPPVPWIADLRDLWAENDSEERSPLRSRADERLERWSLSRAAMLTASSERSADRFRRRYPAKTCTAIATGYDEDEWQSVPFGREEACTLLYAGNFYRGKRDPAALFGVLARMFGERRARPQELRVDLYCEREAWLMKEIAAFGLEDAVRVRGCVARGEVLAAQRRADRLLVFTWDSPAAEGVVPGKLFEYFGARRSILAIGGTRESSIADLLSETNAGTRALTGREIEREILAALAEHAGAPRIVPQRDVAAYTARACASRFAEVLGSALRAPGTGGKQSGLGRIPAAL